jgi:hypothetical protein
MAIVINGSGTVTGLSVGGLPDGTVDAGTVAADVATQAELDAAGVGGATGVDFNDNVKARFGTGNDLEIYHDGTDSYIHDSGTGNLQLRTNGSEIGIMGNDGSEYMGKFVQDGTVELYHNGVKKIETTADGVTVSGTTVMTGSGQTGNPATSGTTQVDTVAEFSGAGNQRLFVGTDTSSNTMWFQNNNPGSLDINYAINLQPNGGLVYVSKGNAGDFRVGNFVANGTGQGVKINSDSNQGAIIVETHLTSARSLMMFVNGNGTVGSIQTNSSSTSYNTSSDYRLKENVDYTWDATTRLKQLKPARFNFIADDTNTLVDGFLAHEVSSIVPEAISGEKDAMQPAVLYTANDDIPEGKEVGDVKFAETIASQSIDQSKLVPLLVKTIQELEARITALEG